YVLGFARHPALGIFLNEGGDDVYNVSSSQTGVLSLGFSETYDYDRTFSLGTMTTPSLGVFLDTGGKDTYSVQHTGAENGARWRQALKSPAASTGVTYDPALDHGVGIDSP